MYEKKDYLHLKKCKNVLFKEVISKKNGLKKIKLSDSNIILKEPDFKKYLKDSALTMI